jgi:tetratricopeptide (TPR) repeat protein
MALHGAVIAGQVRAAPSNTKVPKRLRALLLRGLSAEPEDRFPSMTALLEALGKDPKAQRMRLLAIAASVLVVGGALLAYGNAKRRERLVCRGAPRALAGIWDSARKGQLKDAFLATRLPFAGEAWKGVERALDTYAQRWSTEYQTSCEDTFVRGVQPRELMNLRQACLQKQLDELRSLGDVLGRADATVVTNAARAAGALTLPERCADIDALRAPIEPPADANVKAEADRLRTRLVAAQTLLYAGKYPSGLEVAQGALTDATRLGYRPVVAEAEFVRGLLLERSADYAGSEQALTEAVLAATASRHDELAGRAWIHLSFVSGIRLGQLPRGTAAARHATALLQRLRSPAVLQAELASARGSLAATEGKYAEAVRLHRESLDLRRRIFGPSHPDVVVSLINLGWSLTRKGDLADALKAYEQAIELTRAVYGPEHPKVASALSNLGALQLEEHQPAKALESFVPALVIQQTASGTDSLPTGSIHNNLCAAYLELGRLEEAQRECQRALNIQVKHLGPEHPELGDTHNSLGRVFEAEGRVADAVEHFERAVNIKERALGGQSPEIAIELSDLGRAQLAAGNRKDAVALLTRALVLQEKGQQAATLIAPTRFALARALWATSGQRERALTLATRAEADYEKAGAAFQRARGEVREWLARAR